MNYTVGRLVKYNYPPCSQLLMLITPLEESILFIGQIEYSGDLLNLYELCTTALCTTWSNLFKLGKLFNHNGDNNGYLPDRLAVMIKCINTSTMVILLPVYCADYWQC